MSVALGADLTAEEADLFEAQVAPQVQALFGARLLDAMIPGEGATVVHLCCRTGYHDEEIARRSGASALVGVDVSAAALEVARSRLFDHEGEFSYVEAPSLPSSLPTGGFTHAVSIYTLALRAPARQAVIQEAARLLQPGGQMLLAMPLRGSFQELNDLLREFALRGDLPGLGRAVDALAAERPTIEQATEDLESAGFEDVDVELYRLSLEFNSGSEFFGDPGCRLLIEPALRSALPAELVDPALNYLREAIDLYWSEGVFDLSMNLGCANARR